MTAALSKSRQPNLRRNTLVSLATSARAIKAGIPEAAGSVANGGAETGDHAQKAALIRSAFYESIGARAMRVPINCMDCFVLTGTPSAIRALVEFRDDGLYEMTCPEGHRTFCTLQNFKHEVLFEIGVNAIYDGYYREAVTSFAASLERFYEFAVRLLCIHLGHDADRIAEAWKTVTKQSERQLGAFIFVRLAVKGKAPNTLPDWAVTFRNKVVHQGYIPTRDEALRFGEVVRELIETEVEVYKDEYADAFSTARFQFIKSISASIPPGIRTSTIGMAFTISASNGTRSKEPLEKRFEVIARMRAVGLA